jgi:hypothetical protein
MLGMKARVAAAFKSVGFHERDKDLGHGDGEKEIVVVESVKMGSIPDPHLDYGQGKIMFDCTDIYDHAKGRRRRKTEFQPMMEPVHLEFPPMMAPANKPPDGNPPPIFEDFWTLGAAKDTSERTDFRMDARDRSRQVDMAMDKGGGEANGPPKDLDLDVQNGRGMARCPQKDLDLDSPNGCDVARRPSKDLDLDSDGPSRQQDKPIDRNLIEPTT